jgi:hypothetical protein
VTAGCLAFGVLCEVSWGLGLDGLRPRSVGRLHPDVRERRPAARVVWTCRAFRQGGLM